MREQIHQSNGQQWTLASWAIGSVGSARRLLRELGEHPEGSAPLNELVLTVHAVRCYADMAGFGRVCALAERLEDDMCNARNAGAPVNPIWLEGVERQLEAIRSCLDEGSDPRAAESVAAPQH